MFLNCGVGEDSWESLVLQGDQTSQSWRKSVLNSHWKDWCWSWSFNTLATWCKELTHLKRPWCWERLKAGGEGDNRGWDGWMASPTQWTWVWVNSGSWWWTGKPGVLQSMGSQRVGHNWVTELNWICQTQSCTKICPWWHAPSIGSYKISLLSRQCVFSVSWHWVYPPKWIRCDLCFQKLVIIIVGIKSDLWRDSEGPCSQLPKAKRKRRKSFTQGEMLEPSLKFVRQTSGVREKFE